MSEKAPDGFTEEVISRRLKEAELLQLKQQKYEALRSKRKLMDELPHKFGFKRYKWQTNFFFCYERDLFLTAANQIGKSTVQISTAIEFACNVKLWPVLFKRRAPRTFWYLYPSLEFATSEVEDKWMPDLLPRGDMLNHPTYGWKAFYNGSYIHSIRFNSGVKIYFKAYSQPVKNLQGATLDAIFADEELPEDYWDELNVRRQATNGLFRMAFTATIGQTLWYDTMERQGTPEEKFTHAKKMQISLYDCKEFEDGTPSHIDDEYIARAIASCKSHAEMLKRVMGRFAQDTGLKYPTFDRTKNVVHPFAVPRSWPVYVGVDIGSGGGEGHPSAIVFCAVSPDYTDAVAFAGWLGEDRLTTDMDVFEQLILMIGAMDLEDRVAGVFYDYHAKDFGTIADRNGFSVEKADKSHETGEAVLGVLFKMMHLKIFQKSELDKLVLQLSTLKRETPKRHAIDDFVDGLRYALSRVPFDWKKLGVNLKKQQGQPVAREDQAARELRQRRDFYLKSTEEDSHSVDVEEEMRAWSEMHDI